MSTARDAFERMHPNRPDGALVNVKFGCQATRCICEVTIEARMTARQDGGRLYEYNVATSCPQCGHRLFQHKPLGDAPVT
jgi:hypothetical protein